MESLYPFLYAETTDLTAVLDEVRASTVAKITEISELRQVIARRSSGLMSFVERYRRLTDLPEAARVKVPMGEMVARLDRLMAPMLEGAGIVGPSFSAEFAAESPAVGEGFGGAIVADVRDGGAVEPSD